MRSLFKKARETAPSIIFIDEIDAIGRARASGDGGGAHHEHDQTLNALLVAMDGQRNTIVTEGSPIEITVSKRTLALAQRRDYSHFEVMRAKLKWSGGFLDKK